MQQMTQLPAAAISQELNEKLLTNSCVVVTAPPGAGKSTLLPVTVMQGMGNDGKILMLEPRRLAARQIAERMAFSLGEKVGDTVGYRVRFESKVSSQTRIEVLTEGILTRIITDDQTLDGVSVVIFDEFHERSLNTDLALALVREAQQVLRPDLRIVIMSATIDATEICNLLHAPLIESEGRMFPVHVSYAEAGNDVSTGNGKDVARLVAATISRAHREHQGDILAFLPGQSEIMRCMEALGASLQPTRVMPLYANLPPDEQRLAIAPSAVDERKVVLATPIAETSVTIQGVMIVVDSGLCRSPFFNPRTGLTSLQTVRISQDMATQRMGRAGRVAEGYCYRLWTHASSSLMEAQRKPEIADADLAPLLLAVAAFGESDIEALPWLTKPSRSNIAKARELLQSLGAISNNGNITAIGKRMALLPCHPRIARMILSAGDNRMRSVACDIAAVLEEKDLLAETADSDITLRLSTLRSKRKSSNLGRWQHIARIASEYRKMTRSDEDNTHVSPTEAGILIAHAYPERIAMSTDCIGNFRLASGDMVRFEQTDTMAAFPFIAIASLNATPGTTGKVFLAAPVDVESLNGGFVKNVENISWDQRQGCVTVQMEKRIGKLTISTRPIQNADKEKIKHLICQAVKKNGLSILSWNDDSVVRLQRRVAAVASWHPELSVPDISTVHMLETAAVWLPLYLEQNGRVLQTVAELRHLNLSEILWASIPYELQQEIDLLAPTHCVVPTGSRIRIDYRPGAEAPVLSVRLQECFGMEQTPTVDNGKQKLLMELLSPGFKPVQLTQDLSSFWRSAYFEVRKEMRRRYPKHYWPENPLEAEAVKGVKKKQ